jgi:ribonuclease R
VLKEVIRGGGLARERARRLAKVLPEWGLHASRRERLAMEAEREIVALKKAQFMQDKVGEEFDGFVSGVVKFGFFVELAAFFVEGLVPMRTLDDDEYIFHERLHSLVGRTTKRTIRLGDRVRVCVDAVDVERRTIDFSLVAAEAGERAEPAGLPGRRAPRGIGAASSRVAPGKAGGGKAKKRRPERRGGSRRAR